MSQYRLFRHLAAMIALGAFATAGCFVVDDTDDDDDEEGDAGEGSGGTRGGSGGAGGSATRGGSGPAGGSTSTGGSETGGSETGGSDAGGTGPAGGTGGSTGGSSAGGAPPTGGTGGSTNGAVMKFCNGLARGGMDITLTLEFAGVTASALSGECTPVVPNACMAIPIGADPTVELREGTEVILSGSFPTLEVVAGDELLVLAALDEAMMPNLYADTFVNYYGPGYTCRDTDPATQVPPTMSRSAPFMSPEERQFRNQLNLPSGHLRGALPAYCVAN